MSRRCRTCLPTRSRRAGSTRRISAPSAVTWPRTRRNSRRPRTTRPAPPSNGASLRKKATSWPSRICSPHWKRAQSCTAALRSTTMRTTASSTRSATRSATWSPSSGSAPPFRASWPWYRLTSGPRCGPSWTASLRLRCWQRWTMPSCARSPMPSPTKCRAIGRESRRGTRKRPSNITTT